MSVKEKVEELEALRKENASYKQSLRKKNKKIAELEKLKKAISEENDVKSLFVRKIASSLRIPLQQIIQFSHIGLRRIRRKESKLAGNYLAEVKLLSEELMIYINELIEFICLQAGESSFHFEEIDVQELLCHFVKKFEPVTENSEIKLYLDNKPAAFYVSADYHKLSKVIIILIRNALQYVPEKGRIRLSCSKEEGKILINITDNGSKMPEEQKQELFELFAERKLNDDNPLSFGLSICKELMLGLNGDIQLVEAEKGFSSSFILSLPEQKSILS